MLSPNQIKAQSFAQVGRGAYRAQDVDAFMARVYESYAALASENVNMKKKFSSLTAIVEEYNEGKNAIATALVKAQAVADQTLAAAQETAQTAIAEAQAQADALLEEKKLAAERYAAEKKETADAYFKKAETELQRILTEAEAQSRSFVDEVNAKAAAIIADANEKAANLVAAAYKDAQRAQEKANEILAGAKAEMLQAQSATALFKQNALASLGQLLPLVQAIQVDAAAVSALDNAQSDALPQIETPAAEAPTFDLENLFETFDMNVESDRAALAEELAPQSESVFAPATAPAQDGQDENEAADDATPAPAGETQPGELPVYHPFEAPQGDLFAASLFDRFSSEDVKTQTPDLAEPQSETAKEHSFEEVDVTDEPQPVKFKLTHSFDIFDEDEES